MAQSALHWNVVERGTGMPVLLVHGFPLDHSMWQGQFDGLASHCHLIAPDLPGFGRTTPRDNDVLSMSLLADDLDELLEKRQMDQPIALCGLSMGGYVALQFWRRHRERLAALILCDTRAKPDTAEVAQTRRDTANRVLKEGSDVVASSMIEKLFSPSTRSSNSDIVERMRQVMTSTPPKTVASALLGMAEREDFTSSLSDIDVPVLVICGENDAITPLDEMKQMAAQIPGARFVPIHNAGHLDPLEQPTPVNTVIHDFLRHIRPPRQ
jgi:3-oxoadipate enol-lactonase